jgi:hypothetical protein
VPVVERAAGRPVDALTVPLNVSAFGQ